MNMINNILKEIENLKGDSKIKELIEKELVSKKN